MLVLKVTAGQHLNIGERTVSFKRVSATRIDGSQADGKGNVKPWVWLRPDRESKLRLGRATLYFNRMAKRGVELAIQAPEDTVIRRQGVPPNDT